MIGLLVDAQTKGHVFVDVQVGEKGVSLKHRVHRPLVWGRVVDCLTVKIDRAGIRRFKAANDAQGGSLAAARRAQKCDELLVVHIQIDGFQNFLVSKILTDIFKADQTIRHFPSPDQNVYF